MTFTGDYDFTLADGSALTTIHPLESNGFEAQSVPRQILDVTFGTPNAFVVADNVTARFIAGMSFEVIVGPFQGTYTVDVGNSTYDVITKRTTIPVTVPIIAQPFNIVARTTGAGGAWEVAGAANGDCVWYPGSTFTVAGNSDGPSNGPYTVASATSSGSYSIFSVSPGPGGPGTTWTIVGDVTNFFVPGKTFNVTGGTNPGAGVYTISSAVFGGVNTVVTVLETIVGTANTTGIATPNPAITRIVVTGIVPVTAAADGTASVPASVAYTFSSPPTGLALIGTNTYSIIWHLTGNFASRFVLGCPLIIKGNSVFNNTQMTVFSAVNTGPNTDLTVHFNYPTFPALPDATGTLTYPLPPLPYGFIQYSVFDLATSLMLVGRGAPFFNSDISWGQALQTNDIRLLESFSSTRPPAAPLQGQTWFNEATSSLFLYTSGTSFAIYSADNTVNPDVFKVAGDYSLQFPTGTIFTVANSVGNNGSYTVVAPGASFAAGFTTIPVTNGSITVNEGPALGTGVIVLSRRYTVTSVVPGLQKWVIDGNHAGAFAVGAKFAVYNNYGISAAGTYPPTLLFEVLTATNVLSTTELVINTTPTTTPPFVTIETSVPVAATNGTPLGFLYLMSDWLELGFGAGSTSLLDIKASVRYATTAALAAYTAAGAGIGKTLTANVVAPLVIDGFTPIVGDRVLIKDEAASHVDHGIYTVTDNGTGILPWKLTRATDADGSPVGEVTANMFTWAEEGTTNADTGWVLVTNNPITVDVTALQFSKFALFAPGGSNTQVQFNDSGVFGGDADFTWDKTTNTMTLAASSKILGGTGACATPSYSFAADTASGMFLNTGINVTIDWNNCASKIEVGNIITLTALNGDVLAVGASINLFGASSATPSTITLTAGTATAAATAGGDIDITAGDGNTSGDGGTIALLAGTGGATGGGGGVTIQGGLGGGTSGDGGVVNISGGPSGASGNGGNVGLTGGTGTGAAGNGGLIDLTAGAATGTGTPGVIGFTTAAGYEYHRAGSFSVAGDAQTNLYILRTVTTDATANVEAFLDGAGGTRRMVLPTDTTWQFEIKIVARRTDVDSESAAFKVEGAIFNNAGTTTLVDPVTPTTIADTSLGVWTVLVDADNGNSALRVRVTGDVAKNIRWVAFVRTVEVTG